LTSPGKARPVSVDPARLKLTNEEGTEGVLLGLRCRDCGTYAFGTAAFCQACTSANLEPAELGKRGTLYSYTVVRVPPAGWPGPAPYILGQVELPEGPHLLAEVIDCPEAELKIGMGVELALRPVKVAQSNVEKVVYKWRPISDHPHPYLPPSGGKVVEVKEDTP
jgi:uncharacterized OB-fold protein